MSKLALGTVQFGLNYGVANKFGIVEPSEVKKIFLLAKKFKINLIDTAIGYGESKKYYYYHGLSWLHRLTLCHIFGKKWF